MGALDFGEGQANMFVSLAQISGRNGTPFARRSPFLFHLSHFDWTPIPTPLQRHSG